MASEQMPRREDKVLERETHFETHRVVDLGKGEKERELVADRARAGNIVKGKEVEEGRRGSESGVHHVRKFETKGEEKKGLREKAELENRTRVVEGRDWNKEEKQKNRPKGKVEAEKGRPMEKTREEAKGRETAQTKAHSKESLDEEQGIREENKQSNLQEISKKRGEAQQKSIDAIGAAKERYEREKHAASEVAKERNMKENEEATKAKDKKGEQGRRERESGGGIHCVGKFEMKAEEKGPQEKAELERGREVVRNKEEKQKSGQRGKVEAEKAKPLEKTKEEAKGREKAATKKGGGEEQGRGREENEQPNLEEISKYRGEAQQKSISAIEAAEKRAKQSASEAAKERNTRAKEEAKQAKHVNREMGGQPGNVKAKVEAQQEKGHGEAKNTIGTVDHNTAPSLAERVKSAGGTTAQYLGEKATQAKDATVESGKSAAKVAADLKDQAMVTGWSAAQYSTEITVEGTKAATNVVKGAAEYAGQKASELAAKSVDTAKGLAAAAGENAKEYTARKKVEAEKDLEVKREAQNQESKERPSAKATTESFQRGQQEQDQGGIREADSIGQTTGIGETKPQKPIGSVIGESIQEKGSEVITSIGETLGSAAQTIKKPLDIATEGGREVLGAVGETVVEIGENMTKPAQKVQQHQGEEGKGGGVFNAIGETIAEIAETTKVIVTGDGEKEIIITSHEYDLGNQGDLKLD